MNTEAPTSSHISLNIKLEPIKEEYKEELQSRIIQPEELEKLKENEQERGRKKERINLNEDYLKALSMIATTPTIIRKSINKKRKDRTIICGRWSPQEEALYKRFIKEFHQLNPSWQVVSTHKKRQNYFIEMSKFIKTRTPRQCRSHDQKFRKQVVLEIKKEASSGSDDSNLRAQLDEIHIKQEESTEALQIKQEVNSDLVEKERRKTENVQLQPLKAMPIPVTSQKLLSLSAYQNNLNFQSGNLLHQNLATHQVMMMLDKMRRAVLDLSKSMILSQGNNYCPN